MTPHDVLYLEIKSTFAKLVRSLHNGIQHQPFTLSDILVTAECSSDRVLIEKGAYARKMLQKLVGLQTMDETDYIPRMNDVLAELQLLGDSRREVANEL